MQALYHNKAWLTRARTVQGRALQNIGDECGVSRETIRLWCNKFGIPSKPMLNPPIPSGFETFLDYVQDRRNRGWSCARIADEVGCSFTPISKYTHALDIDVQAVRFHLRVNSTTEGCWEWQGYRNPAGYGALRWRGSRVNAHRVAWELAYGPIPGNMHVLHTCDNPACCNPSHLFLGTHADNMQDRNIKNRGGTAKLTPCDVVSIRKRRAEGETRKALSQEFGVARETIKSVCERETWKWIE